MAAIRETAFAKINLALHVRRRRPDGYHELETLFAFAEDGDRIEAEIADCITLTIGGRFGGQLDSIDNLVVKAAKLMRRHFAVSKGAKLHLDKQLPVASGIGGGSADAAATARLLNRLWGIDASQVELERLLEPLGADIPACVRSKTVFGEGIGTVLRVVDDSNVRGRPLLLVNPLLPVSTASVFKSWDGLDLGRLTADNAWTAVLTGRNDLQTPAISICPEIGRILELLLATEADLVRMSGSGATCFALFDSHAARDRANAQIAKTCPGYWTMASSLR